VVKLKDTHTGNTLCSPRMIVTLPKVVYPKPNVHAALKTQFQRRRRQNRDGLAALPRRRPHFPVSCGLRVASNGDVRQGDLHLAVLTDRLKRRYKVEMTDSAAGIPFRETIKGRAESKYRHKKRPAAAGQFAEVWMRIEPRPRNTGVEFTQTLSGQNVDRVYVPSVEKGVMSACTEGILAGYRVVDLKIDFYDGKMHPVDSNDISFKSPAKKRSRKRSRMPGPACSNRSTILRNQNPEEARSAKVIGDLSSRRGENSGYGHRRIFSASSKRRSRRWNFYHYATTVRSLTGGRGIHTEESVTTKKCRASGTKRSSPKARAGNRRSIESPALSLQLRLGPFWFPQ